MKPSFASRFMSFGRVNASERKITSGSRSRASSISHSQNGYGLGVRVVDAKNANTVLDPEQDHVAERKPERRKGVAVEVDVDDILVALGRVLGELDGAVRPPVEPLGMLLDPGMVRRALDGEVERDLEAVLAGRGDKAIEVLESFRAPDARRRMAAVGGPDGIDAARVGWSRAQGVVAAFSVGDADRMNGRQIENIEAEVADIRKASDHIVKRAMAFSVARLRPGEQLVPGAESSGRAVNPDFKLLS